jgi:predicted SnoaL-like aldol condensation-catalyzing enzyme
MTIEANKQAARAFYDLMFNQCQPKEAIERFAGANYIQHNPVVPDGKDGFIAYFERMAAECPGKRVRIIRAHLPL